MARAMARAKARKLAQTSAASTPPTPTSAADKNNTGLNIDDDIDRLMDQKIQEKKLKNQILEDDDDSDFTDLPDFSAVEITVQPSSPPIKQFKRISDKEKGN